MSQGFYYLYFWAAYSDWLVGPDYTSGSAYLLSTSNGNTRCPEAEGDSWQYWDSPNWQSGGVEVQRVVGGSFPTKTSLRAALYMWASDRAAALSLHGPTSRWDVSAITDMEQLFYGLTGSDADVSAWEGLDVSSWDTSSVTTMYRMFFVRTPPRACCAHSAQSVARCVHRHTSPTSPRASQPLVSPSACLGVTRQDASAFNQPLSLDTSSVTDMNQMFYVRTHSRVPCLASIRFLRARCVHRHTAPTRP